MCLANKYSEAGRIFNNATLNFLREKIRTCNVLESNILEDDFFNYIQTNKEFYYKKSNIPDFKKVIKHNKVYITYNKNENYDELDQFSSSKNSSF